MRTNAKRRWLKAGIILGALLTASPLVGLAGTIWGMSRAFAALGSSGIGDPSALSVAIGDVLVSTVAGVLLMPVGLALLIPCVIVLRRVDSAPVPSVPPPLPPPL